MAKRQPKKPHEMTTDEAVKHLFHPDVVEHLKRSAEEASEKVEKGERSIKNDAN
jgi:hypothetical protein